MWYDDYGPYYYDLGMSVAHYGEDYKNKRRKHPVGFEMPSPKKKKRKKN